MQYLYYTENVILELGKHLFGFLNIAKPILYKTYNTRNNNFPWQRESPDISLRTLF